SAMEAGTIGLEIGTHDVAHLVREAADQTAMARGERAVRVTADLPDAPLLLDCDRDQVIQVLVNLLENAVKFTPEGEDIRVSVRHLVERPDNVPESRWPAAS